MASESHILLDEPNQLWKLKASDGSPLDFEGFEGQLLYPSITLRQMVDDLGEEMGHIIRLTNMTTPILRLVKEWLVQYHSGCATFDPETADTTSGKEAMCAEINSEWGQVFWAKVCTPIGTPGEEGYMTKGSLKDLTLAANYLDIPYLIHMTTQVWANFIKGKTPDQIRETFEIEDDFTEEEKEQVLRENEWAREEPST